MILLRGSSELRLWEWRMQSKAQCFGRVQIGTWLQMRSKKWSFQPQCSDAKRLVESWFSTLKSSCTSFQSDKSCQCKGRWSRSLALILGSWCLTRLTRGSRSSTPRSVKSCPPKSSQATSSLIHIFASRAFLSLTSATEYTTSDKCSDPVWKFDSFVNKNLRIYFFLQIFFFLFWTTSYLICCEQRHSLAYFFHYKKI